MVLENIVKIMVSLLFIALNSILIHYIIEKLNFKDKGFDNPTTIALFMGILFYISTLVNYNLIIFLIILLVLNFSVKYYYDVSLKESIKVTLIWLLSVLIISIILSLLYVLIY